MYPQNCDAQAHVRQGATSSTDRVRETGFMLWLLDSTLNVLLPDVSVICSAADKAEVHLVCE